MYGYIKPYPPELKVREQAYFRAVYCGLCRTMGKCTGQCSRLTLSYDFTFLALIRYALTGETPIVSPHRCLAHPLKKRDMAKPDDILAFSACASAIIACHKTADDQKDERGTKRCRARLLSPFAQSFRRKALKRGYEPLNTLLADDLQALAEMEDKRLPSVDRPANLFGQAMADLLSYGLEGDVKKIAGHLGHHLGRWIYMTDAADDYEEDLSHNRYNPFACLFEGGAWDDSKKEEISFILSAELFEIEAALDLCEDKNPEQRDLWGVIRNILHLGMPSVVKLILYQEKDENLKSRKGKKQHEKSLSDPGR